MSSANQIALHGDGIRVTYYPGGTGPVIEGKGRARLFYQHHATSMTFHDEDVTEEKNEGLGRTVTVTLSSIPDFGSTTFTLLVPEIVLPDGTDGPHASAHVRTLGITRISSTTIAGPAGPDTYEAVRLRGTASLVMIPD
ncbi:MAG TPA: hypothetical protein VGP36_00310 [Mycobacteriales bacterium]|jgi:hypothetical protein|nr:hypothetical protein [Mycobacteriales bacterium]